MAFCSRSWPLTCVLVAYLALLTNGPARAGNSRAMEAADAITTGRQQFLQGLRGALAAVAAQKENSAEKEEDDALDEAEELPFRDPPDVKTIQIQLPDVQINTGDQIVCTATSLTDAQQHIVGFSPLLKRHDVVHIALYGCPDRAASKEDYWSCNPQNLTGICQGPTALMYEWTGDKCDDYLAKGEAITVGGAFIHNVVLMVQYDDGGFRDSSGLQLKLMPSSTSESGIMETVQYYSAVLKNPSCNTIPETAESSSSASLAIEEQLGSDFPAMSDDVSQVTSSSSAAASMYEASQSEWRSAPPRQAYVEDSVPSYYPSQESYMDNAIDESAYLSSSNWATRLQDIWNSAGALAYGMVLRGWWPRTEAADEVAIGQVAGIATDSTGQLFIFHRADRRWRNRDFDSEDRFLPFDPIEEDTVLTLDPNSGKIVDSWGGNRFYLPHGMYIDGDDNLWLTDVAMHQVFRFRRTPDGTWEPALVLGERFVPGDDLSHFCKPTDVAVDSRTGEFYVADGYCNQRVLKFRSNGTVAMEITAGTVPGEITPPWSSWRSFQIPHSLALIESRDIICVADRENARIQCFNVTTGELERQIASPMFGNEVFAIAYNSEEDVLYAVNGPDETLSIPPLAFTLDIDSGEILSTWDPYPKTFGIVHDIATFPPTGAVYMADIGLDRVWKFETTANSIGNEI